MLMALHCNGDRGPDAYAWPVVTHAIKRGLIERITLGVEEPTLVLTPAGTALAIELSRG